MLCARISTIIVALLLSCAATGYGQTVLISTSVVFSAPPGFSDLYGAGVGWQIRGTTQWTSGVEAFISGGASSWPINANHQGRGIDSGNIADLHFSGGADYAIDVSGVTIVGGLGIGLRMTSAVQRVVSELDTRRDTINHMAAAISPFIVARCVIIGRFFANMEVAYDHVFTSNIDPSAFSGSLGVGFRIM